MPVTASPGILRWRDRPARRWTLTCGVSDRSDGRGADPQFGSIAMLEDGVAARDMVNEKAAAFERAQYLPRFERGKARLHGDASATVTFSLTGSSRISLSDGSCAPSLARLSRYPRMASLAFSRASSNVSPSETRPGSAGHVTTYPPSSAGSNRTVKLYSWAFTRSLPL